MSSRPLRSPTAALAWLALAWGLTGLACGGGESSPGGTGPSVADESSEAGDTDDMSPHGEDASTTPEVGDVDSSSSSSSSDSTSDATSTDGEAESTVSANDSSTDPTTADESTESTESTNSTGGEDDSATADSTTSEDESTGSDDGPFTLTSEAFANEGHMPLEHACLERKGSNRSPPLRWEHPPEGTQSYALTFIDLETDRIHLAVWDLGADTASIPEAIEAAFEPQGLPGAKQAEAYTGARGYAGPCPYRETRFEFVLHALGVANADGLDEFSTADDVLAFAREHEVGIARLVGRFAP